MLIRALLIFLGTLCLGLGILGIFVPGLPTTPFLLLTAGLYMKGSPKLHHWLITNRYFGGYITNWQKTKGLTLRTKIKSVMLICIMIAISVIFFLESTVIRIVVILLGLVGVIIMGFVIPTTNDKNKLR